MHTAAAEWISQSSSPSTATAGRDVKFLQKHWDGPIILKGIPDVEETRKRPSRPGSRIVVSNHGGRQTQAHLRLVFPSTWSSDWRLTIMQGALPRIVVAVGDKLDIITSIRDSSGSRCAKAAQLSGTHVSHRTAVSTDWLKLEFVTLSSHCLAIWN